MRRPWRTVARHGGQCITDSFAPASWRRRQDRHEARVDIQRGTTGPMLREDAVLHEGLEIATGGEATDAELRLDEADPRVGVPEDVSSLNSVALLL
jgi:hypothetical protein